MAVSQSIQILDNKSQELSVLYDYIKNPNLIKELAEDIKKLNALSADEEKKAQEAREYIKKYDAMEKQMEAELDALAAAKKEHAAQVAGFSAEAGRVSTLAAAVDARTEALNMQGLQQAEERKSLDAYRAKIDQQNTDERAKLKDDLQDIKDAKAAHAVEADRLAQYEKKLKEKAEKIRGLVAD